MITTVDIARAIASIHARIGAIRDELNAADRVLGDGDTGMTVAQIVEVWHNAAPGLPDDVGQALTVLARETRRASGSTLGSVIGIALSAAGKHVTGQAQLDRERITAMLEAATSAIASRSGASSGDKTVLDALVRIEHSLAETHGAPLLNTAVRAAECAVTEFREREARIGRARIYGAKSVGHDDPGMLAALLLLRAVAAG
jgi:dihydroxyacetone kinase-like protein